MHKECFGCSGIGFVAFSGLFFEFLTPLYFGGCNFPNSNLFLTIFSAPNVPIKKVQVLSRHQKQWSSPFGSGLPWMFKYLLTDHSTLITKCKAKHETTGVTRHKDLCCFFINIFPMIANGCHGKKINSKSGMATTTSIFFFFWNALQISITIKCGCFWHRRPLLMTYVWDRISFIVMDEPTKFTSDMCHELPWPIVWGKSDFVVVSGKNKCFGRCSLIILGKKLAHVVTLSKQV